MRKLSLILLALLSIAAAPNRQFNYTSHTTIDPVQNNTNENLLFSYLQAGVDTYSSGSITNDAVSASAAIAYSKLNLLNSVTNADINSSAAIVGSKLDLTSPGAIGSTSANTGTFTTLTGTDVIVNSTFKLGSTHQGDILYDNGTSLVRLTPGTSGQFLKTQGASANPTWDTPANGFKLTSTTNVSAAATTGAISISADKVYFVKYDFVNFSGGDVPSIRFNGDTGAHYFYTQANATNMTTGATEVQLSPSITTSSTQGISGHFYIEQRGTSSQIFHVWGQCIYGDNSTSSQRMLINAGIWSNSANATSFAILTTGGATFTGVVYLYELQTS